MLLIGIIASTLAYYIALPLASTLKATPVPMRVVTILVALSLCFALIYWLIRENVSPYDRARIRLRLLERDPNRLWAISCRIAGVTKKVNKQLEKSRLDWLMPLLSEVQREVERSLSSPEAPGLSGRKSLSERMDHLEAALTASYREELEEALRWEWYEELPEAVKLKNLRNFLNKILDWPRYSQLKRALRGKSYEQLKDVLKPRGIRDLEEARKRKCYKDLEASLSGVSYVEALMDVFCEMKVIEMREALEKLFDFRPCLFRRKARMHLANWLDRVSFNRLVESLDDTRKILRQLDDLKPAENWKTTFQAFAWTMRDIEYKVKQNRGIEEFLRSIEREQKAIKKHREHVGTVLQIVGERSTGKAVELLGKALIYQGDEWGDVHRFLIKRADCRPGFSLGKLLNVEQFLVKQGNGESETVAGFDEAGMLKFLSARGERVRRIWKNCGSILKEAGLIRLQADCLSKEENTRAVRTVLTLSYSVIVRDILKTSIEKMLWNRDGPVEEGNFVYTEQDPLQVYILQSNEAGGGEDKMMKDAMEEVLTREGCLRCSIITPEVAKASFADFKIDVVLLGFECVTKNGWFIHPRGLGEPIKDILDALRKNNKASEDEEKNNTPLVLAVGEAYKVQDEFNLYDQDTSSLSFYGPHLVDYIVTDCDIVDSVHPEEEPKKPDFSRHALRKKVEPKPKVLIDLSCCIDYSNRTLEQQLTPKK